MPINLKRLLYLFAIILPGILLQVIINTGQIESIIQFLKNNYLIYLPFIFISKIVGVVYPPFPGTLLTFSAIPVFGWEVAYFLDIFGSFSGSCITFYLGKRYGYGLMRSILGDKLVEKIKGIRLKKHNQIESAIVLRFASIGILSDGIVWGASMWGFKFQTFIIGYMIAHFVTTAPLFLLLGLSVSFSSWLITFGVAFIAWILLYRFKGRYFE